MVSKNISFRLVPKLRLGNLYLASPLLDRSSESWSFKNPIPKRELGNEQYHPSLALLSCAVA